jgi:hypothetical protein
VRNLVAAGTDIVLTTHYLEEADELADQVVVIDHGKAIAAGRTAELKAGIGRDVIEVVLADGAQLGAAAAVLETLTASPAAVDHTGRRVRSQASDGTAQLSAAIAALGTARIPRLLSLPIARSALVTGRTLADFTTNGWSIIFTAALGFAFGFRLPASTADGLAALSLCLLYGLVFTVVFIVIGLIAPSVQAANGMSMIAFVLAFISSTYVPTSSMPGWLQPFARYQPVTPMVNAALIVACTTIAAIRYRHA